MNVLAWQILSPKPLVKRVSVLNPRFDIREIHETSAKKAVRKRKTK